MQEVFISYSHKDNEIALSILNFLENHGINCWIDFRDAVAGVDYAASIVRAIKSCKYFLLVLSTSSCHSGHVLNEVNSAVNASSMLIPFKIDSCELNESMEYYIGKIHWFEAWLQPLEDHLNGLIELLKADSIKIDIKIEKNSSPNNSKNNSPSDCRMLRFEDLVEMGYTSSSISTQLVENDYINCNGIDEENEGTAEQWEGYLRDNSDTFQYLVDAQNKIVGNWSIVALMDEVYEKAITGQLLEKDLNIYNTEMICFPGIYNGYILAISLLPMYRSIKNYNLLIDSFFKQIEAFAEYGIFFRRWCINVFGKEVEALVRKLGFQYLCQNKSFGTIYELKFMPLPQTPIIKRYPKLVEYYEKYQ